jgi:hypothetical protein
MRSRVPRGSAGADGEEIDAHHLGSVAAGTILGCPSQARDPMGSGAIPVTTQAGEAAAAVPTGGKTILAKINWRRVCPAGQTRCACADTGTSACCTKAQRCDCAPVARCR